MSRAQITLTVEESKYLIAHAVAEHDLVKRVLANGTILLKGGSTVSFISEILTGKPLRLCGIITERGTVTDVSPVTSGAHVALLKNKEFINIDEDFLDHVYALTDSDLIICGANAIDSFGNAALMVGSPGGGETPLALNTWYAEGVPVIIPVGLEKMIPGNINDIVKKTGRRNKLYAFGMSVGLVPIIGDILTEIEALEILFRVQAIPIGAGGLGNAQGSVTFDVSGSEDNLSELKEYVLALKERKMHANVENECKAVNPRCGTHLHCIYKSDFKKV